MSTQGNRRDEETHLSASHLGTNTTLVDEEDWGSVPKKSEVFTSVSTATITDDLEEALNEENVLREELEEDRSESNLNTDDAMQQVAQLQKNLPTLISSLETKLKEIDEQREKLDEEEKGVRSRINFLRVLSGQSPIAEDGRKNRKKSNEPDDGGPARSSGGKRYQNSQTLVEAIVEAMMTMSHEGKENTGTINAIAAKVFAPKESGGIGYNTTSQNKTNTIRIQMYRLRDKNQAVDNKDGTYTLLKNAVEKDDKDDSAE